MERITLALSALLQRNSPAHGLVKLPPFASSYEISKNQEKSINETVVSSISTYWSIQSISIKSDLSIDNSIPILSIDYSRAHRARICIFSFQLNKGNNPKSQSSVPHAHETSEKTMQYSMNTYQMYCVSLYFRDQRGATSLRFNNRSKSPSLCVNRGPFRYSHRLTGCPSSKYDKRHCWEEFKI